MAFAIDWTEAFEALPPDTVESPTLGAKRIRDLKKAVRERLEKILDMDTGELLPGKVSVVYIGAKADFPDASSYKGALAYATDEDEDKPYYSDGEEWKLLVSLENYVATTGDQNIEGEKTFKDDIKLTKANVVLTKYSAGTVNVAKDSTGVTGVGTLWSDNIKAGMFFQVAGDTKYYIIASVGGDTHIILTEAYAGETGTGKSYTIGETIDERSVKGDGGRIEALEDVKVQKYDSAAKAGGVWFSISTNNTYATGEGDVPAYDLGKEPDIVQITVAQNADGSGWRVVGGDTYGLFTEYNQFGQTRIVKVTATQMKVRTGPVWIVRFYNAAGGFTSPTSGYCRIVALVFGD